MDWQRASESEDLPIRLKYSRRVVHYRPTNDFLFPRPGQCREAFVPASAGARTTARQARGTTCQWAPRRRQNRCSLSKLPGSRKSSLTKLKVSSPPFASPLSSKSLELTVCKTPRLFVSFPVSSTSRRRPFFQQCKCGSCCCEGGSLRGHQLDVPCSSERWGTRCGSLESGWGAKEPSLVAPLPS